MTAVAGVLAEADADAGLRNVLARVLEANERWEQLAAELRAENAQLREENARLRQEPARSHEPAGLNHCPDGATASSLSRPSWSGCSAITSATMAPCRTGKLFRGARGGMLSASVYGRVWHAARRAAARQPPKRDIEASTLVRISAVQKAFQPWPLFTWPPARPPSPVRGWPARTVTDAVRKPADLPEHTDGPLLQVLAALLPCLQRPVGIAAVFDTQDDDFAEVFPDAIKDPISTPTRRPHPGQVIAQRLADPGRLLDQCVSEELDDSRRNRLRQVPGQCPLRRRGKDEFAGPLLAHRCSRRTASTPRMTSPRA